jgi:hypothetical protein
LLSLSHQYLEDTKMISISRFSCAVIILALASYVHVFAQPGDKRPDKYGAFVVDGGGRPIKTLEAGSSLYVGAAGLRPDTTYEFRVALGDHAPRSLREAVSFARSSSDQAGNIAPFVLWYQAGVIGCSPRVSEEARSRNPMSFRTFDESERALAGKVLTVSAYPVERDRTGRIPPHKLKVGDEASVIHLPVIKRRNPAVYTSDKNGCLLNSQLTGDTDLFVSGRNFKPGSSVEISVVPNQRAWFVNDAINDITGVSSAAAPERVKADANGRFTVKVWDRSTQQRGVYDVIAHDLTAVSTPRVIGTRDVISYAAESGFIFYLIYPIGGPTMDIAGRPIFTGSPYFEFADSFALTTDPVWGAVDPTYVPAGHPGGNYAAYYVVNHRDVAGWDPSMGGSTNLVDVSGGIEIHPVKAGCINGTDVVIWPSPLNVGNYDAVVDFGSTVATTPATYVTDGQYNSALDFLDGANQIGFVVATDPYDFGPAAIGQDEYSQDDFFATLGTRSNVDLRAVVRYPATSAGVGTPVAPGLHPIFIIEHGNHSSCNTAGFDCTSPYDTVHTGCPSREQNHKGYMGLLDRLASHGIIAVSIDAYDLTGCVPQLIPERSDLILKHLELWSHMNNTGTFPSYPDFFAGRFASHVDMTKISVSGHSRGGEASVGAYMRNLMLAIPFNIGSVSSIAPVDGQAYVLPDVPYFVIIPAADGDVFSLSGIRIYDRAGSTLPTVDGTVKSGIDVYGASHNFFNTVWAADGDDGAVGRDDFIPAADQQRIGESYLLAFARIHLKSEVVYEDMLRGRLTFPSTAGYKIYPMRHEKTHLKVENGTGAGAVASSGATVVSVGPVFSVHRTQAIQGGWPSGTAQVTYSIPATNASSFQVLSFRVAQTNSATNPVTGNQNFFIELVGGGMTKGTFVGNFGPIPKPYNHSGTFQNVMTTIRIPLQSFIMNNSGVTLNNIDTVRIRFLSPIQGEIYVDDIEFSR